MQYAFFVRGLLVGALLGVTCGALGCFVVLRGMAFLGDAMSHTILPGVVAAYFLGWPLAVGALVMGVLTALGIGVLTRGTALKEDTAIGVFFALSVALGAVFLAKARGYVGDAMGYLFGSLLAVGPGDLWAVGGVVLLGLALLPLWGALAYATFDRELALADRVPVGLHDYLLSAYLALALVVAVKVVGVLLVAAFLVIPGAAARLLGRTFAGMTLLALLFALSATLLGLYASFLLDWPSGASVVLAQALLFGLAFLKTAFSGGK